MNNHDIHTYILHSHYCSVIEFFIALMVLPFTTRRMVGSAHLALYPIRFTAQLDFAVSDTYSYEKYILHRWVRRDRLISPLVFTSSPSLDVVRLVLR